MGALGGAVIMKFMQHPKPVVAPVASAAPAAVSAQPAPVLPAAPPTAAAEPKPSAFPEKDEPAPPSPKRAAAPAIHPKPVRQAHAVVTVAQNLPPAQPQPAPEPIPAPLAPAAPAMAAPAPVSEASPALPAESVETPAPQPAPSVTLQAGLLLPVRLGQSLSSDHNQACDTFTATLDSPVSAGGFVIAERGARVEGRVVEAQKSNHLKGQAALVLELTKLSTSDGQHVAIQTESFRKEAPKGATGEDVGIVAAAAGIGAVIGAIAGGGKGAAIGAGAGGVAGTGGVVATRAKSVALPTETKIAFRLKEPVTITEQLNR